MMGDRAANIYECPHGCKAQGGKPIAASIRGWKKHMTRQHGQWSDEQLAVIVGAAPLDTEKGRSLFLAEGDDTPGLHAEDRETTIPGEVGHPAEGTEAQEPPKKRVKFKPKAMREFLSGLPEMFFKAKGIETDESDKKLLDAASEMMEELFGFSIEVPDSEFVIRSRWMALLFPFAAILVVWGKHTFTMDFFKKKDENAETQNTKGLQDSANKEL